MKQMSHDEPYGYCPTCQAPGVTRQRCPNGNDTCANGHHYPSRDALVPRGSRSVSEAAHGSWAGGVLLALAVAGFAAAALVDGRE